MRISDWSSDVCSSDLPSKLIKHAIVSGKVDLPSPQPHTQNPPCGGFWVYGWGTSATAGNPARRPIGPSPPCGDVRLRHPACGVEPPCEPTQQADQTR